jgi:hypothetical protein
VIIGIYFLMSHDLDFFGNLFQELMMVKWHIFFLSALAAYAGALSFTLPFVSFMIKNKVSLRGLAFKTLSWVYKSITGKNSNRDFMKKMKIRDKFFFEKIRLSDVLAIFILIVVTRPFVQINTIFFTWILIFEAVYIAYFIFSNRYLLSKEIIFYVPASISRYFLEMFAPLLIFLSMNILLDLSTLLFFTASTSLLYYIPKFKLAGGLLDLYVILMFSFLSSPLLGLVAAILFRMMSILFFIIPISLIKSARNLN